MVCYCWNLMCERLENRPDDDRCQACGESLLLRDRYRAIAMLTRQDHYQSWQAIDQDCDRGDRAEQFCFIASETDQRLGGDGAGLVGWKQQVATQRLLGETLGLPGLIEAWTESDNGDRERGYTVRRWVEGQTLAQEQQHRSPWDETEVRSFLTNLLPIVQYIHSCRLVHGNLQPETIVRDADQRLIPISFRYLQPISSTRPGDTTPPARSRAIQPLPSVLLPRITDYCAPERLRGGAVPASDLYSLGAIAVQLLTTLSPLELYDPIEDRWDWRDFIPHDQPVSPQFGRLLDRLLTTSLQHRYESAGDVISDLDDLPVRSPTLENIPIATTIPIPPAPKSWQRWLGLASEPALSPTGLDCTNLRDHLAAQDWSAADRETATLICTATQTSGRYLHGRELEGLAADDLVMIDRLWREASGDRFGWSVQQRIYREGGGDYAQFCARVGWPLAVERAAWTEPWQYRASAPEGHLPSRRWAGGAAMRSLQLLFDRVERCHIALPPRRPPS
jgi:serine/threonine protein kinase